MGRVRLRKAKRLHTWPRRSNTPDGARKGRILAAARADRGRLSPAARREDRALRGRSAPRRRAGHRRLHVRDRGRDPALTASYDRLREGRGDGGRRAQGLLRPRVQRAASRRWLSRLPTVWVEGEVTELRRQERWASVFFTLKDPEDGACLAVQMPRGAVRRARARPRRRRARARLRPAGALRAARRAAAAGADDRALRSRRAPRRARAAEAKLAAEGLFDADAQAAAAALPAADRARHRQRRRREAGRAHAHRAALPAGERPRRRDVRPGASRAAPRSSPRSATCAAAAST